MPSPTLVQQAGWTYRQVKKALQTARGMDYSFGSGQILGSMCTQPHEVAALASQLFLETNLGDPAHFPGAAKMEQEVVADLLALMHAPPRASGRFVSGGTEANILAMYLARQNSGRREVIVPDSAHFSFEKAAKMLDMELVWVRTHDTGHANVDAMKAAITRETGLIVGIAGTTELGLVDPIEKLGRVAKASKIPLHVDGAFGGYVLPFMEAAGRRPVKFDFQVPGVTSISVDPHKMGMSIIPAGALMVRNRQTWKAIEVETDYVSTDKQANIAGTRPGAAAAATWAVHRRLGREGFAAVTETCLDNAAWLAAKLVALGHELVAPPELNVVTFKVADVEATKHRLDEANLRTNAVPRFGGLRVVVNPHVTRPVLEKFLAALGPA